MKAIVAEDTDVARRLLAHTVERCGHDVIAVADGGAAWEAFEQHHPKLVILDWQMPVLDGVEVCRRIRAISPARETFVLMVTGRDAEADLASALASGVDDYITKPVTPAHLRARLLIAEQRMAQHEDQKRAEDALAHARWLAGIGETALALQHELNNPLFALLGHAELFASDASATPAQRQDLDVIVGQARRIADVVKRLAHLKDPRTVSYAGRARMLDLSGGSRKGES